LDKREGERNNTPIRRRRRKDNKKERTELDSREAEGTM